MEEETIKKESENDDKIFQKENSNLEKKEQIMNDNKENNKIKEENEE